jgi:hypothetical protein
MRRRQFHLRSLTGGEGQRTLAKDWPLPEVKL